MAWKVNEETGELYDDGMDSGAAVASPESIPPKPPPEVLSEPVPEHAGTIMGYGNKLIMDKGNKGVWTKAPWGDEPASPEYVKEIQDTMAAYDRGEISEEEIRRRAQPRANIPGKPTDEQLTSYERWKKMEAMAAPDLDAAEKQGAADYRKSYSAIDEFLMNPRETAAFHATVAQAGKQARDKELTILKSIFDKAEAERDKTSLPTKVSLYERSQKGDKIAAAALKKMQEDEVSVAAAKNEGKGEMTNKDIYGPIVKALPKKKIDAEAAERRVIMYENLAKMAENGAGGLVPGLKGILAPVAEALGMDTKIMSEAQAYQLMARAGVGSMRLMLVGSGQVSNYEQDLMQRLSGGSIKTSREAAKLLFNYYATESRNVVAQYNKTIEDVSREYPEVAKAHGYIGRNTASTEKPKPTRAELEAEARRRGLIR